MVLALLVAYLRLLEMCMPRNLQVDTNPTAAPPMERGGGGVAFSPKDHNHVLSLPHIVAEIVCSARLHKFFRLLPVHRLVVVGDQSNHSCVICKLHYMIARVPCRAIICEECVQQGAQDTSLWGAGVKCDGGR